MSVLIRGMDMPKNCNECKFCWDSLGERFCFLNGHIMFDINSGIEKHPDCPLVEVPTPHGRLIDSSMAYQETLPYAERTRKMILKVINSLPTVIEAEE